MSLAGFKTEERKGLRVGTQQSLVQDFTLEVGAVRRADHRHRRSAARRARERDASPRRSTRTSLQNLPIFGRNAFYAAISTPGVIQSGDPQFVRYQDQSSASYLSLGGGPRRGNGYLLEGVPITDFINRPTIVPSIEAVEELKVQTKTYEADMGHAAGGVFNTTARSGSNAWHGSALLRQQAGLRRPGSCTSRRRPASPNPPQYYHNWAGSLGGPIVKNKTFFWFSTDDYEQRSTRNNVLTLPTALERAGDFSQTRNAAGQPVIDLRPADDAARTPPGSSSAIRFPAT